MKGRHKIQRMSQCIIMKIQHVIPLVGATVLFCACIPSLNPFYTQKDVVTEPRLVREWKNAKDPQTTWNFETNGKGAYTLHETDKDQKAGEFTAVLFKIDKDYFLDVIPNKCDYATNQSDLVSMAMFPGHLLFRVLQFEPTLKTSFFDFDWLSKTLKDNPKLVEHHLEGESIILTAPTPKLQKFVRAHIKELFTKEDEWTSATNAPSASK